MWPMASRSRRPISSKEGSRSDRLAPWLCKGITENRQLDGHMMAIRKKRILELHRARAVSCLPLSSRRTCRRRMIPGRLRTRRAMQISTREAIVERVRTVVVEQLWETEVTLTLRANRWVKTWRAAKLVLSRSTKIFNVALVPASKPLINQEANYKWFTHPLKKQRTNWLEDRREATILLTTGKKRRANWLTSLTRTFKAATTLTKTIKK